MSSPILTLFVVIVMLAAIPEPAQEATPEIFREVAAGIYVGLAGSGMVVTLLPTGENRGAVRTSWDEATELLESVSWGLSSGVTPLALRTAVRWPAICRAGSSTGWERKAEEAPEARRLPGPTGQREHNVRPEHEFGTGCDNRG
jgi:hypothetical protein